MERASIWKSALILAIASLADCSTPESKWRRPGATERQRAADYAYCQNNGQLTWTGSGRVGIAIAIASADRRTEDNYRACMRARGWTTEEPNEKESAQNQSQQEQAKIALAELRSRIPTTPTCALGAQLLAGSSAAVVIAVGPSATASGIHVGDRIVRVNHDSVTSGATGAMEALQKYSDADEVPLTVQRTGASVELTAGCIDRRVQMEPTVAVFEAMAAGQWSNCFDRVADAEALLGASSATARLRLPCRLGQIEAEEPQHRMDLTDAELIYESRRRLIADWSLAPEGADHVRADVSRIVDVLQRNGFPSLSNDLKTQFDAAVSTAPIKSNAAVSR
jgi:hypothetical protein